MTFSALLVAAVLGGSPSFSMPECKVDSAKTIADAKVPPGGGPEVRAAAQRGLAYLAKATPAWQKANNCYGCHVQAVTLEAFAVGVHHQYEVPKSALAEVLNGMFRLPGGSRGPKGLSYHDQSLFAPSKAFGGAAFARFDQWVDAKARDDLWKVAKELRELQRPDGSIDVEGWVNPPVGAGNIQATYQAMQTWRQTYARTADDLWLTPLRKAEKFIHGQIDAWNGQPPTLQDANYALMAMMAAGVSPADDKVRGLERHVLSRQHEDGSWDLGDGKTTPAFATGQALYALRTMGRTDQDAAIARGTRWLVKHQRRDGGWSDGGFGKAEAMWGVLGLVSVDVLTVAISGVEDGQRITGKPAVTLHATDNQGGAVKQVELLVDDLRVAGACGPTLSHPLDTATLTSGKHVVEAVAINARGERSVRRLELYAGDVFLADLGSQFTDETTTFALRNLALPSEKGAVRLTITGSKNEAVFKTEQPSAAGPMSFSWAGKDLAGKARPRGKYTATVAFVDAAGATRQTLELVFAHETVERIKATFAEVQGRLNLGAGRGAATNVAVELVDDDGNVVQRVSSTAEGQYRFKNVDPGKYKVRVQGKKGFDNLEAPVTAEKAKEAEVSGSLNAQ